MLLLTYESHWEGETVSTTITDFPGDSKSLRHLSITLNHLPTRTIFYDSIILSLGIVLSVNRCGVANRRCIALGIPRTAPLWERLLNLSPSLGTFLLGSFSLPPLIRLYTLTFPKEQLPQESSPGNISLFCSCYWRVPESYNQPGSHYVHYYYVIIYIHNIWSC